MIRTEHCHIEWTDASATWGANAFPGIGNLIAWLICIDLAHAGVVEFPALTAMGRYLKAGALKGLQLLNGHDSSADGKNRASPLAVAAFGTLYRYLEQRLTTQQRLVMLFNVGLVEHTLCKYKRCESCMPHHGSVALESEDEEECENGENDEEDLMDFTM